MTLDGNRRDQCSRCRTEVFSPIILVAQKRIKERWALAAAAVEAVEVAILGGVQVSEGQCRVVWAVPVGPEHPVGQPLRAIGLEGTDVLPDHLIGTGHLE